MSLTSGFSGKFVVFRAASFTQAVDLLKALVTFKSGGGSGYAIAVAGAALAATLALDFVKRALRADRLTLDRVPAALVGVGVGALAVGLVVFSGGTPTPFIYFQF